MGCPVQGDQMSRFYQDSSGFGCFVLAFRKTSSGRKNVPVLKNRSIAHNKSSLIGLICAKITHVKKLSLKNQRLLYY
jgi:hypothetical protein